MFFLELSCFFHDPADVGNLISGSGYLPEREMATHSCFFDDPVDVGNWISGSSAFFKTSLGLVHWDDPEGWYGEGGKRRVQDGEHMYTCGGFTYNIVKFKNKIK